MKKNFAIIKVSNANDLVTVGEALGNSFFRGHSSANWELKSTLERDAEIFNVPRNCLWKREEAMLSLFKKRARLYTKKREYPRSKFEWHALVRHYGGPSRLLDVTSSYLVSAYFALADSKPKQDAAIWVFREEATTNKTPVDCNSLFEQTSAPRILVASPDRLNLRLHAQSGAFIVPGSVETPLQDQIGVAYDTDFNAQPSVYRSVQRAKTEIHHRIWKLIIPRDAHSELFRFLSRCNVRGYSLFPGTDGLALSLREMMRVYD